MHGFILEGSDLIIVTAIIIIVATERRTIIIWHGREGACMRTVPKDIHIGDTKSIAVIKIS